MTEAKKPRLLLADDSMTIRKVVELTFAEEGVDVTAVGSGEEAMQRFVQEQPDILLVDVNMPDPTGYHICEMIKQDESTRHIPVLLLVGSFEPFDQDEAERVGADGFMVKPFQSIRELVGKVNELLGPGKEPVVSKADTADIDNLYRSSLGGEAHEENGAQRSDVYLGDAGFDDEMIETVHPSDNWGTEYQTETDQHVDLTFDNEPVDDWSANKVHVEPFAGQHAEHPSDEGPFDSEATEDIERGRDHEHPFEGEPDHSYEDQPVDQHLEGGRAENVQDSEHQESFSEPEAETEADRALRGFDWSAKPVDEEATNEAPSNGGFEPHSMVDDEEPHSKTAEEIEVDTLRDIEVDETAAVQEPTDEFITRVARLVVEKLSDRVVREIAREAVPQIAEKLIREALEEEGKS